MLLNIESKVLRQMVRNRGPKPRCVMIVFGHLSRSLDRLLMVAILDVKHCVYTLDLYARMSVIMTATTVISACENTTSVCMERDL